MVLATEEKYSEEYGEGDKYGKSSSNMSEKYVSEIKVSNPRLRTVSDAMIKDGHTEETSKFVALSG